MRRSLEGHGMKPRVRVRVRVLQGLLPVSILLSLSPESFFTPRSVCGLGPSQVGDVIF